MQRRRISGKLIILLLMCFTISACSGNNSNEASRNNEPLPTSTDGESGQQEEGAKAGKSPEEFTGEVVFYNYIYYEPLHPKYEKLIEDFNKVYPNIKVRMELGAPGEFTNMIAAGDPPDLTNWSWVNIPWVEDGLIEDLTPYMERDNIDEAVLLEPAKEMFSYNDKLYGMPWFLSVNSIIGYNKKIFDNYGLDGISGIETLQGLGDLYGKFWVLNNGEYEMTAEDPFGYGSWLQLWQAAYHNGADQNTIYNAESRKVAMNDPKIVEALEWMINFKREYIQPDALARLNQSLPDQGFYAKLPAEKQALGIVEPGVIKDVIEANPNVDFGYAALPDSALWLYGHGISMLSAGKNKEAAWEFLKWLGTSQEGAESLGRHFNNFSGLADNHWAKAEAEKDPAIKVFVDAMQRAKKTPPVMPADYVPEFSVLYPQVIEGTLGAQEFLDHMTSFTQQQVDQFYAGK